MSRILFWRGLVAGAGLGLIGLEARAAEMALKARVPHPAYDWSGFYLGGHVGYGGGGFGPATNPLPLQGLFLPHSVTGMIGGYQAGYLRQLSNHIVLGIEADASFTGPLDGPASTPAPFHTSLDYAGRCAAASDMRSERFCRMRPRASRGAIPASMSTTPAEASFPRRDKTMLAGPRAPVSNLP